MRISDWSSDVCSSDLPVRCLSGCRGEKGRASAALSNAKRPRSTGRVGNRRARPVRRASPSLGTGAHPACRPGRGDMTDTPQSWPALSYLETLRPGPDEAVERLKGKVRIVIQRGRLAKMRRTPRSAEGVDQFVREVDFDEAMHSWHPKEIGRAHV